MNKSIPFLTVLIGSFLLSSCDEIGGNVTTPSVSSSMVSTSWIIALETYNYGVHYNILDFDTDGKGTFTDEYDIQCPHTQLTPQIEDFTYTHNDTSDTGTITLDSGITMDYSVLNDFSQIIVEGDDYQSYSDGDPVPTISTELDDTQWTVIDGPQTCRVSFYKDLKASYICSMGTPVSEITYGTTYYFDSVLKTGVVTTLYPSTIVTWHFTLDDSGDYIYETGFPSIKYYKGTSGEPPVPEIEGTTWENVFVDPDHGDEITTYVFSSNGVGDQYFSIPYFMYEEGPNSFTYYYENDNNIGYLTMDSSSSSQAIVYTELVTGNIMTIENVEFTQN